MSRDHASQREMIRAALLAATGLGIGLAATLAPDASAQTAPKATAAPAAATAAPGPTPKPPQSSAAPSRVDRAAPISQPASAPKK